MDFSRSTNGVTALSYLNIVQRGGTQHWKELYQQCKSDRNVADAVAGILPQIDPDLIGSYHLWNAILQTLYSDIVIEEPQSESIGV